MKLIRLKKSSQQLLRRIGPFKRWSLLALSIGIVSGLGSILFTILLRASTDFFLRFIVNYYPPAPGGELEISNPGMDPQLILLPIVTTLGGLISGILVYKWAPEAEGHGTDAVIDSFHNLGGKIRKRIPVIKTLSSVAIIGSGGSAGREGPIAQIGAGFGSWVTSFLNLDDRDRRIAVVCGAAGGIGSIFKAPLGGAIFSIEVLYHHDFEAEALVPSFISSMVAYSIYASFAGFQPIFETPYFAFLNIESLIFYAVLGIIAAPLARIYIKIFYGLRDAFKRFKIPNMYKPAIGGLLLGLMAVFIPEILGPGYGWIQMAMEGKLMILFMLLLIFAKIIATSLTISSGGSGGVFAPSLFIGGMLGGAFGQIVVTLFPTLNIHPGAFVLIGMAAFFSGAAKVPIASIIMVSEMTGDYFLLPPLMLACTLSYLFSGDDSIYENQVPSKADSPVHRGKFTIDILERIYVKMVMTINVDTVSPDDTVYTVSRLIGETGHLGYPVVEDGKLIGIVTYADVVRIPVDEAKNVKVRDIMTTKLVCVFPTDTLNTALRKMHNSKHGHLPVVDNNDPQKLLGIITKSDLVRGHEVIRRVIYNS